MSRRSRHAGSPSRRIAAWRRAVVLGVALLGAWLGLASQAPRAAPSAPDHALFRVERPVAPGETCLSRSSREPTHIDSRRTPERIASDPPRFHSAEQHWPDELPPSAAAGRTRVGHAVRDASRTIPPRQARGPPPARCA